MKTDLHDEIVLDVAKLQRTILHALRHDPWKYGLDLDDRGWTAIEHLLMALRVVHFRWDSLAWGDVEAAIREHSDRIQVENGRIRASYGHSVSLSSPPALAVPPNELFHGTGIETLEVILRHGLQPIGRQFVHLTSDEAYAIHVSANRCNGVVLTVKASQAHAQGIGFRKASDHVWLTLNIPPVFLNFPPREAPRGDNSPP